MTYLFQMKQYLLITRLVSIVPQTFPMQSMEKITLDMAATRASTDEGRVSWIINQLNL
jgi:hypothetical protein